MSRGRSIITVPKSSWERSTKREKSVDFDQENLQEEFKIVTQYKYHHWKLRTISRWSLIIRGCWITFQKLRKKEENFDDVYFKSSKLPCNITSMVHKIRKHWNEGQTWKHASGNRWLYKAGKSRPPRKQQRWQRQQQQQSFINASKNELHLSKERDPSRGQNLDYNCLDARKKKTLRWHSHLQERVVSHHDEY